MTTESRLQSMTQFSDRAPLFDWAPSETQPTKSKPNKIRHLNGNRRIDTRIAALSILFAGELVSAVTPFAGKLVEYRASSRGRHQEPKDEAASNLVVAAFDSSKPINTTSIDEQSVFERLLNHLGRMNDGWAGEGSLAPIPSVLRDIDAVSSMIDRFACPEAEIDPEDGTVRFVWDEGDRSFSLIFNGRGKVVGVLTPVRDGYPPWSLSIEDELQLSEKITSDYIADIVCA